MKKPFFWYALKLYGELGYKLGRSAAYYWALRAMCNICGYNWYGEPCGKVFRKVGWIEW